MTCGAAVRQAVRRLAAAGVESPEADARILFSHVCGGDLGYYLLHERDEMEPGSEKRFFQLTNKRAQRIPLQYLTGSQSFMGLDIRVSEDVLIPRQDTEILGEEALRLLKKLCEERLQDLSYDAGDAAPANVSEECQFGAEDAVSACVSEKCIFGVEDAGNAVKVLDLCTGSGCLAVAMKVFAPECEVTASDISEAALEQARENAASNQADITFIRSDLFEDIHESFDVIVSNPPYIPSAVIGTLSPEVREHEPGQALDGGEDGLDFYRKIADGCGAHLMPGGYLLLEIGDDQGETVSGMLRAAGFSAVRATQDLSGRNRVVLGRSK